MLFVKKAKGTRRGESKLSCATGTRLLPVPPVLKTISGAITVLTSSSLCLDEICDMVACKGRRLGLETRGL